MMRKLVLQACLCCIVLWLMWMVSSVLMVFLHVVMHQFGVPPSFNECFLSLIPVIFFLPWKKMLDNVDD